MGFRAKLQAKARGEVSTAALAAYSSANSEAYSLLDDQPATGTARLAAWCAFVLQTHADNMLGSGSSPGVASPEACEEAEVMFELVGAWLERAHAAAASAAYVLDVIVPQPLPQPRAPRTTGVLKAMKQTLETVQARAGADLAERAADPIHERLAPMMSGVQSAIDSTGALSAPSVSDDLKAMLGQTLRGGLDRAYQVGQLLAVPELLGKPEPSAPIDAAHDSSTVQLFLPGDVGFDPWCLTDPLERRHRQASEEATAAIEGLWKADPDATKTLTIQAEISSAREQGAADFMPDEGGMLARLGSHCPWPGVLYAKTPLVIAGKALAPGDRFVFTIGSTEQGFRRAVVSISAADVAVAAPALEPLASHSGRSLLEMLLAGPAADAGFEILNL
ncbi:MAG TPA: hypothetical protein VMV08_03325 [Gaiellaceae bacterium]|nr:hypothetical protein [Gaiellaceae bacterium]